jgi:hypothetical protein
MALPSSSMVPIETVSPVDGDGPPGCATTDDGGPGAPTATGCDMSDPGPTPREFEALTVHRYVLPVVRPRTVMGLDGPVADAAAPPLDDVHCAA